MTDEEKNILFYINNYHFNMSKIIYIKAKIYRKNDISYQIKIWGEEYLYNTSITLLKSEIIDKKIQKLMNKQKREEYILYI